MAVKTALMVVDVQVGMFDEEYPVYQGDLLLARVQTLIAKARAANYPIFFIQHNEDAGEPLATGTPGWAIHPALQTSTEDVIVQKFTPDAFHETNLQTELDRKGIRKLIMAGMQTDLCLDATSRRAHQLGYEVVIAQDVHSTWPQGDRSAQEIIDQLNEDFAAFATVQTSEDIVF